MYWLTFVAFSVALYAPPLELARHLWHWAAQQVWVVPLAGWRWPPGVAYAFWLAVAYLTVGTLLHLARRQSPSPPAGDLALRLSRAGLGGLGVIGAGVAAAIIFLAWPVLPTMAALYGWRLALSPPVVALAGLYLLAEAARMAEPNGTSYEIEHDINLVREVIALGFPWKIHHTVMPGTLGVYCFKGRLRDAEGRPNLYPAGTTIQYRLFAAPPWSDAAQYAIIVSQGTQRVKITLRCPLPGLESSPAVVSAVIRFEVTDPIKLVERTPGWEQPETLERLNDWVARDICDVLEGAVRPLANALTVTPEFLTPSGSERLKDLIVSGTNLSERGLSLLSDQPPLASLEYPQPLLEALYDLYAGYCVWQRQLSAADEAQREAIADELTFEEGDTRDALLAGTAPPLEYFIRQRPDLLEAITVGSGERIEEHAHLLHSLLSGPAGGDFYVGLVSALLHDLKRPASLSRAMVEALQHRHGHLRGMLQGATRPFGRV